MLKEIPRSEAMQKLLNSENLLLYHTKYNKIFVWKTFLDACKFLIDEPQEDQDQNEESIESDKVDDGPDNVVIQPVEESNQVDVETEFLDVENQNNDINSSVIENIEIQGISRNTLCDVKTRIEDTGYVDDTYKSTLYPSKGKRKITIDLGKLYALKRAGWSQKAIAEELQCSVTTVNKYCRNSELESQVIEMQNSNAS